MNQTNLPGQRIKELRKQNHLTQSELASKLNISLSLMQKLESGATTLTLPHITSLCSLFGVSSDWLIGYSDTPTRAGGTQTETFTLWDMANVLLNVIEWGHVRYSTSDDVRNEEVFEYRNDLLLTIPGEMRFSDNDGNFGEWHKSPLVSFISQHQKFFEKYGDDELGRELIAGWITSQTKGLDELTASPLTYWDITE